MNRNSKIRLGEIEKKRELRIRKELGKQGNDALNRLKEELFVLKRISELLKIDNNFVRINFDSPDSISDGIKILEVILNNKKTLDQAEFEGKRVVGKLIYDDEKKKTVWKDNAFIEGWNEKTKSFEKIFHSEYLDEEDKSLFIICLARKQAIDFLLKESFKSQKIPVSQKLDISPLKDKLRIQKDKEDLNIILKSFGLSTKQRTPLLKQMIEGKSLTKVAKDLKITVKSVSERFKAAKRKIELARKSKMKSKVLAEKEDSAEIVSTYDGFLGELAEGRKGRTITITSEFKKEYNKSLENGYKDIDSVQSWTPEATKIASAKFRQKTTLKRN